MKILVLGSTGFIGSALVNRLLQDGHEVVGVTRYNALGSRARYEIIESTLNNIDEYYPHITSADAVFHLASDTTPSTSIDRPSIEGVNNILPTLAFLEAMQHSRARLIYVSTGGVIYGSGDGMVDETAPLRITSNYAAGKVAIESFIQAYTNKTGNQAVILRPSNIYGPGQFPKRKFGLIPTVFSALMTGSTFELWGSGEIEKNFVYIDDFTELCRAIVTSQGNHPLCAIYNAGADTSTSINRIIQLAEKAAGKRLALKQVSSRNIDAKSLTLNSHKAFETYQWKAGTPIETGMNNTWQWIRHQL